MFFKAHFRRKLAKRASEVYPFVLIKREKELDSRIYKTARQPICAHEYVYADSPHVTVIPSTVRKMPVRQIVNPHLAKLTFGVNFAL